MRAMTTDLVTEDGLRVYDLEPEAGELCAVAGPEGLDPAQIDMDDLPAGCRWVDGDEWQQLCHKHRLEVVRELIRSYDEGPATKEQLLDRAGSTGYADGAEMARQSGSAEAPDDGWAGSLINAVGHRGARQALGLPPDGPGLADDALYQELLDAYSKGAQQGADDQLGEGKAG